MPTTTSRLALPVPLATDPADIPADLLALANVLDPKAAVFLQGTIAARPAAGTAGRVYYATDTAGISYDTGSAWVPFAASGTPPLLTTLPGSPADGQEVYLNTGGGTAVVWHLRYLAGWPDGYGWTFLGGAPLFAEVTATETSASTSYAALTTPGPAITLPRPGIYIVHTGADQRSSVGSSDVRMSYDIGATPAVDADAVLYGNTAAITLLSLSRERQKTVPTAATLTAKYKTNSGSGLWQNRRMRVTPVRIG